MPGRAALFNLVEVLTDCGNWRNALEEALNGYDHDMADKIREDATASIDTHDRQYVDGMRAAADLIDPWGYFD